MLLRRVSRNVVPPRQRRLVESLLGKVLGSYWKTLYFQHIDKTSLKDLSRVPAFDPGLKLVPFFISEPGVVFDIGANVGTYTYVLEKVVGPQFTYALEPLPQLSSRLRRLFPETKILSIALSDAEGTLDLKVPIVDGYPHWGRSTLEQFGSPEPGETGAVFEQVRVQTLDGLCERMNIQDIRFLKIDVEGHEYKVLRGARNVLAAWRPVLLVEIEQRHHSEPISQIFSWIIGQGYSCYFYDVQQMLLRPLDEFLVELNQRLEKSRGIHINNFFFINTDRAHQYIDRVNCAIQHNSRCE